jgi:indole-3-glycerol phosphate synthase
MTILDKIIEAKKGEINNLKKVSSIEKLKATPLFGRKCISLKESLLINESSGIIAEFKQKSPSKGMINETVRVEEVTKGYANAGVAGLSVLTDFEFFGGNIINLLKAREANPEIPVLRKDFMIDPIQVYEAKAYGADVILLIAAYLEKSKLDELANLAISLGMEVLVEIHNKEELEKISDQTTMVGVNNRDLKTFKVDLETSVRLSKLIPENCVKISESGLSEIKNIHHLRKNGFKGFLIGETFMKTNNPAKACQEFISQMKTCLK